MTALSNTFLNAFEPKAAESFLQGERFPVLRSCANLFNFSGKSIYCLKTQQEKLIAIEKGTKSLSKLQVALKVVAIATLILPLLAYLGAQIYHYFNEVQIAHPSDRAASRELTPNAQSHINLRVEAPSLSVLTKAVDASAAASMPSVGENTDKLTATVDFQTPRKAAPARDTGASKPVRERRGIDKVVQESLEQDRKFLNSFMDVMARLSVEQRETSTSSVTIEELDENGQPINTGLL